MLLLILILFLLTGILLIVKTRDKKPDKSSEASKTKSTEVSTPAKAPEATKSDKTVPTVTIKSVASTNGTIRVTLSDAPAAAPIIGDFTVTKAVNSASGVTVTPTQISFSGTVVTLTVPTIAGTTAIQSVAYSISYKGGTAINVAAFTVAAQTQTTVDNKNSTPQNTCESQIKSALTNKTTTAFQLSKESRDFSFKTNTLKGIIITAGEAANMTSEKTEGFLRQFIGGKIIRITNGLASIDESGMKCSLKALSGNDGISLSIIQGDTMSVTQGKIEGIIRGNTLTGKAQRQITTVVNHTGSGRNESGDFAVSMKMLAQDEVPPLPPINLQGKANSDDSIQLTWEDPNPKGLIKEYEVYRMAIDYSFDFVKIATIPSGTTWTDTSDAAKKQKTMIFYYLVATSKNGLKSTPSSSADIKLRFKLN